MKKGIEQYYSGDNHWNDWVAMSKEDYWRDTDLQKELMNQLNGHQDLAAVIFARLSDSSLKWIHERVPALENLTPLECLETPELTLRLRECLMRMP